MRTVLRGKVQREPKSTTRPSKLDPFRPLIHKLVLTDGLSCVRVLEEIRAVGYKGGDCILKRYVKTFRPKPGRRPHLRFETPPGVQGQVDLSPYTVLLSGEPISVVCFSFVLGFSRWHFIRFLLHADVHSICHCHVLAFEDAGGVPHEILYDRMKQVVLESHKDGVIFHALFERMTQHYGFRAVPLAPGYKEGKGKVENPFKYVEGVRHESRGETDDLEDVILVRVGPDEEGDRERRRDWSGGLQEPSGPRCPRTAPSRWGRATTGAMAKHAGDELPAR